jgi:hypothetical protein
MLARLGKRVFLNERRRLGLEHDHLDKPNLTVLGDFEFEVMNVAFGKGL